MNNPQYRIALKTAGQLVAGGIGAAIIHHDDLVARLPGQGGRDFIKQQGDAFRLIQYRNDDGKIHAITLQQVGCKPCFQTTRYDLPRSNPQRLHDAC